MKYIKKNLKWITVLIVIIILGVGGIIKINLMENETIEEDLTDLELEIIDESIKEKEEEGQAQEEVVGNDNLLYVDIKGAVVNPGVYEVLADKKVIDVVNMAGGLTDKADTSLINLAKKIKDEMVIIIYTKEEVKQGNEPETIVKIIEKECVCPDIKNDACIGNDKENTSSESTGGIGNLININTATSEELLTISGIGDSKAKAIIQYREEHGNFKTIEDIKNVSGIGESLFEKIKTYITV